ncbi:AraC-type DNA-binding protein [Rhodococcus rhodochrous J3]|uniref:AraC-type DNA-binding protein n=1 Tax=Rhodococcus rhodochrous J3 TaxID=903528 RepID=A0ABY1M7Q7_RHORH|nr:AraC family transcriptional regulator [Rhodococcus rhodochrous]MBF4480327.1 helix-turn-helix domain-containing protein [Rhodococcus rhodochrous]SMG24135.1 AraC-type DNA-binding protein [Rhodococcus rhodochrous J3]
MRPKITTVTTDGIDNRDRVAFWEEYNAQELVGLRCSTYHQDGLEARQLNMDLDGLRLADISGNSHVIDRSHQHISATPKDSIFISQLVTGSAFFYYAHGFLRLDAGDMIVYDTTRPYLFGFETDMRQFLLDIPRDALRDHQLTGSPDLPYVLPPTAGGVNGTRVRALGGLVRSLIDDGDADDQRRGDLLTSALTVLTGRESTATALRRTATTHIMAHLTDPDLSVESVARAIGISARHLSRTFAADDTTVAHFIQRQRQRLDGARRELVDSASFDRRIADIAAHWGFSSQAHFTRAFRREFGCTPSEMRCNRSNVACHIAM